MFSGEKWLLSTVNLVALFIVLLSLSGGIALANTDTEKLRRDIRILDKGLDVDEKKAAQIKEQVRKLERELGEQTKKTYLLERKIKKTNARLDKMNKEKEELESLLDKQKSGLSQQIVALYTAGQQSHIRMLLKQDNPSDIGRTVKYFEYLNRSRVRKINSIKETLSKLQNVTRKIAADKSNLVSLREALLIEKAASKKTLQKRQNAYKKISKRVKTKQQRLRELKKKEAKLQNKINALVAKAEANRRKAANNRPVKKSEKNKVTPKAAEPVNKKAKKVVSERFYADRKFSTLRGKLSWPVKGKIIHSYSERRNEKQRWKGTVIQAAGGRKVHAIARGKVEFAGWFNGYGYLVIIRHDNNYRSLYGYNRAVYVRQGQIVKGGSVIAAVGNSGGQQKNALYFEIRKGTTPKNPAKWCR